MRLNYIGKGLVPGNSSIMFSYLRIKHSNLSEKLLVQMAVSKPKPEAFEFLSLKSYFYFPLGVLYLLHVGSLFAFWVWLFCRKTIMCVSYKGLVILSCDSWDVFVCCFYLCCSLSSWKIEQWWQNVMPLFLDISLSFYICEYTQVLLKSYPKTQVWVMLMAYFKA